LAQRVFFILQFAPPGPTLALQGICNQIQPTPDFYQSPRLVPRRLVF
jgi:hypothetical protein